MSVTRRQLELTAAVVLAALLHLWWFLPGLMRGGFQNFDVAGIAYNAGLLLDGLSPYVHSVEPKAPGTFVLFAPLLALGAGMFPVWCFAVLWATLTSTLVGKLSGSIWGPTATTPAILLHAAGSLSAGLGDINYAFWMMPPLLACAWWLLKPERPSSPREWLAIGALGASAMLFKHNAWVLAPLAVAVLVWGSGVRWAERARGAAFAVAGGLGALVVFSIPFALVGHPLAAVDGMVASTAFGSRYVSSQLPASGGLLEAMSEGLSCTIREHALEVGLLLVGAAPFTAIRWSRYWRALALLGVCALGLASTLRFYPHDFVMVWPACVVFAVRLAVVGRAAAESRAAAMGRAGVALGAGLLLTGVAHHRVEPLRNWLVQRDRAVSTICESFGHLLPQDAAVLGWGWSGLSVYHHCGRRAPGAIYKELWVVTTPNTNTCADPRGGPIRIPPSPGLDQYMEALRTNPPALIVISPYYRTIGDRQDPIASTEVLMRFLRKNYVQRPAPEGYAALLRRDVVSAPE